MIFSSARGMYNTLKRGVGMAICPEVSVAHKIKEGELVRLEWEPAPQETTIFMIRHADKWCSPVVKRFMELTKEYFLIQGGKVSG